MINEIGHITSNRMHILDEVDFMVQQGGLRDGGRYN